MRRNTWNLSPETMTLAELRRERDEILQLRRAAKEMDERGGCNRYRSSTMKVQLARLILVEAYIDVALGRCTGSGEEDEEGDAGE